METDGIDFTSQTGCHFARTGLAPTRFLPAGIHDLRRDASLTTKSGRSSRTMGADKIV
jgi:hypothetical protein